MFYCSCLMQEKTCFFISPLPLFLLFIFFGGGGRGGGSIKKNDFSKKTPFSYCSKKMRVGNKN